MFAPSVRAEEDLVPHARTLATSGHRDEAIKLLSDRLAQHPDDSDARTLYGIVLSWEGRYDESRAALQRVLEHNPTHGDALPALINVELWSDRPAQAEDLINRALRSKPNDAALLMLRARALRAQDRKNDAVDVLDKLLEIDPTNPQAREMKVNLRDSSRNWAATFDQSYEWFNDGRDGWLESQLSLKDQTRFGSVIMRASHANRFWLNSNLFEVDAYPSIRPGTYAYLNVGWSPDRMLYPTYRLGAEIFQSLHHGVEASGGLRHLGFSDKVNVYTGSLSKYYGNWLFTARTYVTPSNVGNSASMQYTVRRYFGDNGTYVAGRLGHGGGPVETGSINEIEVLRSLSFSGEFNWRVARLWTVSARGGESHEDRLYSPRLHHHSMDAAVSFRF